MTPEPLARWAYAHPYPAVALAAAMMTTAGAAAWYAARTLRRAALPPAAVIAAGLAAAACTAYSADTSWRFAAHRLGMTDTSERAAMFAAAELALFSTALMARQNLNDHKAPGAPGVLVWLITGVQVIPAFSESGVVGGLVRAFVGPVLAALLWHLAMGIELRHNKPGASSNSLPAMIGRELRERLLSRLGLAVRDRTAEQITHDRWTAAAVALAARLAFRGERGWGWYTRRLERRLDVAVGRAGVGANPNQRAVLLQLLAARRNARALASIDLPSPWNPPLPPARRRSLPALAHQQLTDMHPLDAIRKVRGAHPHLAPGALASLLTELGVVVSETQVRVATGVGNAPAAPRPVTPPPPAADGAPAPVPGSALALDLAPMPRVHPEVSAPAPVSAAAQRRHAVHARVPEAPTAGQTHGLGYLFQVPDVRPPEPETPEPEPEDEAAPGAPNPGAGAPEDSDPLFEAARALGKPASLRTLKTELGIGQARAQRLQHLTREH
ncbi:hypothetical protein ACFZB6_31165 [Streptomyces syringium]|uniref:hypothetical protein n=1 Tax=Streptomyces syringium TaxID=76729 RepID=UPI0036E8AFA3